MPTEVILPKVDMDMATGRISRWFVAEGAAVKKGDVLFEIETDKAAMEIDAPASGTLRDVSGKEGVDIPVGQAVAWIYGENEGEGPAAAKASPDGGSHAAAVPPGSAAPDRSASADAELPLATQNQTIAVASAASTGPGVRATPLARRLARQNGVDLTALSGSGPNGRIQSRDVGAAAITPSAPAPASPSAAVSRTTPVVRHAAGVDTGQAGAAAWLRRGEGAPLVLIHGFGSETASWRPFLSAFDRPAPILSIELPAHGAAAEADAAGFDDLVAHAEALLAAEGVSAAHLVGHSLGGAVATAMAAGNAVEARSLFLLAPTGLGPEINTGFTQGFAAARDEAALRVWMRELVSDASVFSDSFVKATLRTRADGRLPDAQTRLAPRLFVDGTQLFSVRGLLGHLAMPIKVVAGTTDRIIPHRQMSGLPGTIALHVFPGVGHMPHLEVRVEVARLLGELVR